ncbi:Cilia- And Flagella-Associated Protein 70 [Manis pentadactyla]|nr:Cilia- And Flagella-Associated Protein 70 [Manis pentadactyla]
MLRGAEPSGSTAQLSLLQQSSGRHRFCSNQKAPAGGFAANEMGHKPGSWCCTTVYSVSPPLDYPLDLGHLKP